MTTTDRTERTDRYMLISSDGHAGPPPEHYRAYLDPKYRQQFDEHQAEMSALRELAAQNDEFREEWEAKTGDGGLLAAYDGARTCRSTMTGNDPHAVGRDLARSLQASFGAVA